MKRSLVSILGVVVVLGFFAPWATAQQGLQIQGRIVRTAPDQFVVETRDNKQVTFYTNPQTKYLRNNKAVQYSDLRVGANITAGYVTEADRYIVNTVTVAQPATATQIEGAPAARANVVEGEVVRVEGKDRIVIRTADGKETIVYVSPETRYQLNAQGGQFSDLKTGATIGVDYDVRDQRYTARQVTGVTRLEGQVVRVIGQNQVVIRTSDGKEVTVYVSPETRYQLTTQGGQFTDVRPGTDIGVYYDVRDQRPMARRLFPLRRR